MHASDRLSLKLRVWDVERLCALAAEVGAEVGHVFAPIRSAEFRVPAERRDEVRALLEAHPDVERVSLVGCGTTGGWKAAGNVPGGHRVDMQQPLKRMNVFAAWEHTRGGALPLGHVDTGLNLGPSGMPEFIGKNVTGYNVFTGGSDVTPVVNQGMWYHGNATGGLLYGTGRADGDGLYGVAPDAPNIVHARYANGDNLDTTTDWTAAILWAFGQGARVLSCSSYFYNDDQAMHDACDYIFANGGVLVVCAGNERWNLDAAPLYPAVYDSVISVGGVVCTDEVWGLDWRAKMMGQAFGSAFGSYVDILAPTGIMATYTPGSYVNWVLGTSMSVPLVAGVAHLVLSVNPNLTGPQVKAILLATVDRPNPPYSWACEPWFPAGVGIPDAERAVLMAKSMLPANANVVFPVLRAHGDPAPDLYGQFNTSWPIGPAKTRLGGGEATTYVNGQVHLEITGYCNGAAVTEVELWVDGAKVYQGAPTSPWTSLHTREERRTHLREVRVVARAGAYEASRTYETTGELTTTLKSAAFEEPPPEMVGSAGGQGGASATLDAFKRISGTAGGKAGASAARPTDVALGGTAAGSSGAVAGPQAQPPLAGGAAGQAGAFGVLAQVKDIEPTLFWLEDDLGATASFGTSPWTVQSIDGTALSIGLDASGYFGPGVALSGGAAGHAGATATPGVIQVLAGSADAHAGAQGTTDAAGLGAAAGGVGGGSGQLTQSQPLSAEAGGHAGASATGPQTPIPLAGVAGGQGGAAGDANKVPLDALAGGQAGAAGGLRQNIPLAGVAAGKATAAQGDVTPPAPAVAVRGSLPIDARVSAAPPPEARVAGGYLRTAPVAGCIT